MDRHNENNRTRKFGAPYKGVKELIASYTEKLKDLGVIEERPIEDELEEKRIRMLAKEEVVETDDPQPELTSH